MNRGDVVEVDWPYSDLTGVKRRPAVVVQADDLNGLIDDTIYVKIQGNAYGIPATEVLLDPAVETLAGLSKVTLTPSGPSAKNTSRSPPRANRPTGRARARTAFPVPV